MLVALNGCRPLRVGDDKKNWDNMKGLCWKTCSISSLLSGCGVLCFWDLKKGTREQGLLTCFRLLRTFDSLDAVTPQFHASGVSERRYAIPRENSSPTSIHVVSPCCCMALVKHRTVKLLIVQGNHDPVGSVWLAEMFCTLYDNEPRVFVDTSPTYTRWFSMEKLRYSCTMGTVQDLIP